MFKFSAQIFSLLASSFAGRRWLGVPGLICLSLAAGGSGRAATLSWSGAGSSANWSDSGNWGFVGTPTNGDSLIFSFGQPQQTNYNDIAGLTLNHIQFVGYGSPISPAATNYVIGGNSFTLTNGISTTNNHFVNVSCTITNNLALATADNTLYLEDRSSLTLAGVLSGSVGLTMDGRTSVVIPTVMLSGSSSNSYSGPTVVKFGTLQLAKTSGNAIPYGSLTVTNTDYHFDTTVQELADNQVGYISITVDGGNAGTAVLDLNGFSDEVGTNLNLRGFVSKIELGGGTLILRYDVDHIINVYATHPYMENGTLFCDDFTSTFMVDSNLFFDVAVKLTGTDVAGSITKTGAGELDLSGTNIYTGRTDVNEGSLYVLNSYSLGKTNQGTVVNSGASLLVNVGNGTTITNESLSLNGHTANTNYPGAMENKFSGTNVWAGPVFLASDSTIDTYFNDSGILIAGSISGTGGLTKTGSGVLIFGAATNNTYTGPTVVLAGLLQLSKTGGNAIQFGSLTVSNATVTETASDQLGAIPIRVSGNGVFDLNGFSDTIGTNISFGPWLFPGSEVKLSGGTLAFSGPSSSIVADNDAYAEIGDISDPDGVLDLGSGPCTVYNQGDLFFYTTITGAASASITLATNFDTELENSNSFAGPLIIGQGDVGVINPFALGSTNGGTVVSNGASLYLDQIGFDGVCVTNETITLNGQNGYRGALIGWSFATNIWAGPVILGSDSMIWSIDSNNTLKINGQISGTANLSIGDSLGTADGTVVFEGTAANSYSGSTYVYENLLLSKTVANAAIGGPLIIGNGINAASVTLAIFGQIPDTDPVTVNSNAVFNLNNLPDTFGALSGSGSVILGSGTLGPNADNASSTFSGVISGIGGVNKHGSGTLTLTGTNTFTGENEIVLGTEIVDGYDLQSPVFVDSPAKLGGSGTVGTINCSGRLAPGDSVGILTCSNVTFTSSGTFIVQLTDLVAGTGYSQLNVRGTNKLASATLTLIPGFTVPVAVGQTFTIIKNDGVDPITGTFNGLPNGATNNAGGFQFKINYAGGDGNDVVLTLVGVPGAVLASSVTGGNGNHVIDPNECDNLNLVITNLTGIPMTGVTGVLYSTTLNVMVTQPQSAYADLPAGGKSTNTTPFQISTLPGFTCGSDINLVLAVTTASHSSFSVPVVLHTGEPASSGPRYDVSISSFIPDTVPVESTNNVVGFPGPLEKVAVAFWLQFPHDTNLDISLISPDGTTVVLASGIGVGGDFGTNCSPDSGRTTFDDSAPVSITSAGSPFIGTFRPQGNLTAFNNGTANGPWRLHIKNNHLGDTGTLRCWSLFLYPVACAGGGGYCGVCPSTITGAITGGSPIATGRLITNSIPSSCVTTKLFPGTLPGSFHYDIYSFTNTSDADACITVGLTSAYDVESCAYVPAFNPLNVALNYAGDAGVSTAGAGGSTSFSFNVPAGSNFLVTVTEMVGGAGAPNYTLLVSGLPCPPPLLHIQSVATNQARVFWPSSAGGYSLKSKTNLGSGPWNAVTNEPIIKSGNYNVTNSSIVPVNRFYLLEKP